MLFIEVFIVFWLQPLTAFWVGQKYLKVYCPHFFDLNQKCFTSQWLDTHLLATACYWQFFLLNYPPTAAAVQSNKGVKHPWKTKDYANFRHKNWKTAVIPTKRELTFRLGYILFGRLKLIWTRAVLLRWIRFYCCSLLVRDPPATRVSLTQQLLLFHLQF